MSFTARLKRRVLGTPLPLADPRSVRPGLSNSLRTAVAAGRASVGTGTYAGANVAVYDETTRLAIGRYCSIGQEVTILLGGDHHPEWVTTYPIRIMLDLPGAWEDGHPLRKGDVEIGNDVWIGRGATILSGTKVGDGAIIGAGAVVGGVVRPYAVTVGNPAEERRRRFPDPVVDRLLELRWWDWSREQIRDHVDLLCSDRVDELLASRTA